MLLFDALRLSNVEFFVLLTVLVLFRLPSLGHRFLALARDWDDYRANRPRPQALPPPKDDWGFGS